MKTNFKKFLNYTYLVHNAHFLCITKLTHVTTCQFARSGTRGGEAWNTGVTTGEEVCGYKSRNG